MVSEMLAVVGAFNGEEFGVLVNWVAGWASSSMSQSKIGCCNYNSNKLDENRPNRRAHIGHRHVKVKVDIPNASRCKPSLLPSTDTGTRCHRFSKGLGN